MSVYWVSYLSMLYADVDVGCVTAPDSTFFSPIYLLSVYNLEPQLHSRFQLDGMTTANIHTQNCSLLVTFCLE